MSRFTHKITLSLALLAAGCGSKSDDVAYKPADTTGMIMGLVKDGSGAVMGDVKVTVGDKSVTTNNQGYFSLSGLSPTDRAIVNFTKQGYVYTTQIAKLRVGESSYLEATMGAEHIAPGILNGSTGGTLGSANEGSVSIQPGSLVEADGTPYNGPLTVGVTVFDPTSPAGMGAFPGKFEGVSRSGERVGLQSYGFADITPHGENGKILQLAPGKTADVVIPIAAELRDKAPQSIPLWYFDPKDGDWHEEGTLYRDGNVYRGKVPHFSIWNCDVAYDRSYIIGRVMNCEDDVPVKGARVTAQNKRGGWSSGEDSTPEDGTFRIPVNAGEPIDVWASKNGVNSEHRSLTAAASGGTVNLGDVCLNPPKIKIALTWGATPADLDAHLTIPTPDARTHIAYGSRTGGKAALDTDDTDSYGPEIISAYKLYDGSYRYSVQHFAGNGNLANSNAHVTMVIEGVGIYEADAPSGETGVKDVWRLWDIKVEGGKVKSVKTISDYVKYTPEVEGSEGADPFNP